MKPMKYRGKEYLPVLDKTIYPKRYRFKEVAKITPTDEVCDSKKFEIESTEGKPEDWILTIK